LTTSYRNIFLLACCQALLLVNAAGLITMNGLVGYDLAGTKALSTLGVTTYVIGSAVAALPMALWMARVGRRRGFMTGALINVVGCMIGVLALAQRSFWLFCVATAIIGVYNAIGLQYRFAAAEVAAPSDKARAISLVLAGGIVGGFLGPESVKLTRDLTPTPFFGSFVALAAYAIVALLIQSRLNVPPPVHDQQAERGRPVSVIVRQPIFVAAAMAGALGYGLMNLLMTATPIAMDICGHPFSAAAFVIEWHVVGMYAPGFFTGALIKRFGAISVIGAGLVLFAACAATALQSLAVPNFLFALVLLGVGWNFLYTGGTTLLTEAYRPTERAKTQGINDLIVFTTMAVSSLASGAMVSTAGWEAMNRAVYPLLVLIAASMAWLAWSRRRQATPASD